MKEKFTSLGCSFRELLLCCDPIEVATKAAIADLSRMSRDPKKDSAAFFLQQMIGYEKAITEILSYPECKKRPMGFVLRFVKAEEYDDQDWISIGLYNWDFIGLPPKGSDWKEYDKDEHNETFSASFSKWSEHADREVLLDEGSFQHCHNLSDIAAELMWEITFGGFTGKETAEQGKEVLGACKTAMEQYKAMSAGELAQQQKLDDENLYGTDPTGFGLNDGKPND